MDWSRCPVEQTDYSKVMREFYDDPKGCVEAAIAE
jgi:hypothetical protein